ncbi:MAG: DJ-1/PfpI family protein [Planctomycetota bacterium]|jgi:transcriptional regulator GlxA family with amidase domain
MPPTRQLAILLFPGVEILDFAGPYEVFSVASRPAMRSGSSATPKTPAAPTPPAFNVFTVAELPGPVVTNNGLSVNPDYTITDTPAPDILLVPGGQGTREQLDNPTLIDWITQAAGRAELVLSVCTGALLLGKAGLLDGREATTHHVAYDLLRQIAPTATVYEDRRFVDTRQVVTSAGIAAGIDMSLHVVQRLLGWEAATATARQMEYPIANP